MNPRSNVTSLRSTSTFHALFALGAALLFLLSVGTAQTASAHSPSEDQSRNISYIHPPANAVAPVPHKDPLHPAPAPNAGPKTPFTKGAPRSLPHQIPANLEKEDPDNLIRNWKNRRPMEERKRAVEESMAMPTEPVKGELPSREESGRAASGATPSLSTSGWEQIGYGDYNSDGVHYQAGRIRQATYAYDNSQSSTVLWLGATGGGLWKAVDLFFAAVFVP
jgi:hypothetical protein